jgi:hypothetical protein
MPFRRKLDIQASGRKSGTSLLRLNCFLNTKPRWETSGALFLRSFRSFPNPPRKHGPATVIGRELSTFEGRLFPQEKQAIASVRRVRDRRMGRVGEVKVERKVSYGNG